MCEWTDNAVHDVTPEFEHDFLQAFRDCLSQMERSHGLRVRYANFFIMNDDDEVVGNVNWDRFRS